MKKILLFEEFAQDQKKVPAISIGSGKPLLNPDGTQIMHTEKEEQISKMGFGQRTDSSLIANTPHLYDLVTRMKLTPTTCEWSEQGYFTVTVDTSRGLFGSKSEGTIVLLFPYVKPGNDAPGFTVNVTRKFKSPNLFFKVFGNDPNQFESWAKNSPEALLDWNLMTQGKVYARKDTAAAKKVQALVNEIATGPKSLKSNFGFKADPLPSFKTFEDGSMGYMMVVTTPPEPNLVELIKVFDKY
jgi:hypothetical protein